MENLEKQIEVLEEEIYTKEMLIQGAKSWKVIAESTLQKFYGKDEDQLGEFERMEIGTAKEQYAKAMRLLQQQIPKKQDMDSQLCLLKKQLNDEKKSVSSHDSKSVFKWDIETEKELTKARHAYEAGKVILERKIRRLSAQPQSGENDNVLQDLHLQKEDLDEDYEMKVRHIEEEAQLKQAESDDDFKSIATIDEELTKRLQSLKTELPVNKDNDVAGENHDETLTSMMVKAGAVDKDTMLMQLMQTQMQLMSKSQSSFADKKLPEFSGDPAEWGNFKAAYDRTTERYHYQDEDNMGRLQVALKGSARETVKHLMSNVKNVDKILLVLEQHFGRAEFILDYLVEVLKSSPRPDPSKPSSVIDFGRSVENLVVNICAYDEQEYMNNKSLVKELIEKLPGSMKSQWYHWLESDPNRKLNLQNFSNWLETEVRVALRQVKPTIPSSSKFEEKVKMSRKSPGAVNAVEGRSEPTQVSCTVCRGKNHSIDNCWNLKKKTLDERWNLVKTAKVCFACLKPNHLTKDCLESRECGIDGCTWKHHKLLHYSKTRKANDGGSPNKVAKRNDERDDAAGVVGLSVAIVKGTDGPLPIVPVRVKGENGIQIVYALLDSGATRSLMTANLANELGVTGKQIQYKYRTVEGNIVNSKNAMLINVAISGRYKNAKTFELTNVVTVDKIGLTPYSLNIEAAKAKWPHLRRYKGQSLTDVVPELVIGADHGYVMMHKQCLYSNAEEPVGLRTVLGWVLQGKLDCNGKVGAGCHVGGLPLDEVLNQLILESFKLDDYAVKNTEKKAMSVQDKKAIEIMEGTTVLRDDGRWETGLLWKDDSSFSDSTYDEAYSRLLKTERRMSKDTNFATTYKNKIHEYLDKKYVKKLSDKEVRCSTGRTCYIPHFGVVNPNKPGKFRLVFDCAARIDGGCFNDKMLTGPDLIKPITEILWNFRTHKIVICGDIEDMFHRIIIREEDQQAQRFLWRDGDASSKPEVYEMKVMIFGATSSPSCAIFVKDKNAERFREKFPVAVDAIVNSMYVDDNLVGAETVEQATALRQQITGINGSGGFVIKKWISNSDEVMESIPESLRLPGFKKLPGSGADDAERVLGLWWDPAEDTFTFKVNFHKVKEDVINGRRPTKREMCSLLMSIFDPLGFVAHFKIKGMILFQDVWKSGVGWDDTITDDVYDKWKLWLSQLKELIDMKIPRYYGHLLTCGDVQLHTFVDASFEGINAISYFRMSHDDEIEVTFVSAKARVASLKKSTIPRLELQAAVLGSKLANKILNEVKVKVNRCFFWSDSSTVLSWITSESSRFKEFVANRVSTIQTLTNPADWRWVDTVQNVADEGTRQHSKADLSSNSRWLRGPEFLQKSPEEWPLKERMSTICSVDLKSTSSDESQNNTNYLSIVPCWERISSFYRLIRITAAVRSAAQWWMSKVQIQGKKYDRPWVKENNTISSGLSDENLQRAEHDLILAVQQEAGTRLYRKNVKLIRDQNNILHVVGRLENAELADEVKRPILLPSKHRFVDLLIDHAHKKYGHCGRNTVYNSIRQKYWIPGGRQEVRKSWSRCLVCRLRKAKPVYPEMGILPQCRIAQSEPPFTYTGTDLFGPMEVTVGRHHEKRWGMLFTCMVTRGVHIEIVYGLNVDETLMGISRFVDCRGLPMHFYSDNGTNYQAASKQIAKQQKYYGTTWHFIPPGSPHMGGAWESLVKQVKKVLQELMKEKYPKDQTLLTGLKAVENILNSRPLGFVSGDVDDPECLTPNHFLRGVGIATGDLNHQAALSGSQFLGEVEDNCERWGKQWEKAQMLAKQFWERWSREVLPNLLRRNKWNSEKVAVSVGDIVIMVDELKPRNEWSKALVTNIFPGKDGVVRVVEVTVRKFKSKTAAVYRRSVAKICPTGIRCCDLDTACSNGPKSGGRKW